MFPQNPIPQVSDPESQREFFKITQNLNKLLGIQFLDGLQIKSVALPSGTEFALEHKLGREYAGFFITMKNANANVWVSSQTDKNLYLKLTASAACTVDLWVY